jgi:hypothetical protein
MSFIQIIRLSPFVTLRNKLFLQRVVKPHLQAGGPRPRPLVQYIRSYAPYQLAVSSFRKAEDAQCRGDEGQTAH